MGFNKKLEELIGTLNVVTDIALHGFIIIINLFLFFC